MLNNNKIKLRAIEPTDVDALFQWENNMDLWRVSNTITPFSKQVIEQYVANSHLDIYTTKQLRLMICTLDNIPVGCIDLFDFDPNHRRAGVGIVIMDKRKGYASEALSLLIKYAFQTLNLHQLYCNITVDNDASLKLFQNHQFEIMGKKKDWIRQGQGFVDEYLLQRLCIV